MDKMTLLTTQLGLTEQAIQAQRTGRKILIRKLYFTFDLPDKFSRQILNLSIEL